ncbi:MAG: hypothetical protein AAF570_15220, partial [Bacteroidota bacterium]
GQAPYVPAEYVWGTTLITDGNTVANDGTPTETVTNAIPPGSGICNYNNNGVAGPLRVGFNGTGTTTRLQIGAGYFGACELSGNVWEYLVSATNTNGRGFTGLHGDGSLSPLGTANVTAWPTQTGAGLRGGTWNSNNLRLRTSDRNNASYTATTRVNNVGGRGIRD